VLLASLAISAPGQLLAEGTRVTIEIDAGNGKTHPVVVELDETNAPQTSANFKKLVEEDFYKGIAIHRVVPNYIVQMGDPLTKDAARKGDWGTGGPGYTVPAETGQKHLRGSIAMARLSDGVNPSRASSGSQFYVCLTDMPALDGDYTVFGKVVSGLEHFDRISMVAADTNNNPVTRIALIDTNLVADPAATPSAGTSLASALASMPKRSAGNATSSGAAIEKAMQDTASSSPSSPSGALPSVSSIGAAAATAPTDGAASSTLAMANAAAADAATAVESAASGSTGGASEFSALVAEARAEAEKMIDSDPTDPAASEAALAAAEADATASMPSRSPAANDVTAALTQPIANPTPAATTPGRTPVGTESSLANSSNAPRPGSTPAKPKKPEGFFTRMIKKVW